VSQRARDVLRAIDQVDIAREHHPSLFAEHLRADRDCRRLAAAFARYRAMKGEPVGGRTETDEVERVPPHIEEVLATRAGERFERRRRDFNADRTGRRATLTVHALYVEATEREAGLSTVAAGNVERSRGGTGPAGPPSQQTMDDDPRWREHWAVIRSRLERVLELLDEAEGLGPILANTTMLGDEKDKLILAEQGLSPLAVVEKLGRDIAGSPETVRRVRRAAGRSGKDGRRIEETSDSTGPIRRVVIEPRQVS
jgi:hypothetical protein